MKTIELVFAVLFGLAVSLSIQSTHNEGYVRSLTAKSTHELNKIKNANKSDFKQVVPSTKVAPQLKFPKNDQIDSADDNPSTNDYRSDVFSAQNTVRSEPQNKKIHPFPDKEIKFENSSTKSDLPDTLTESNSDDDNIDQPDIGFNPLNYLFGGDENPNGKVIFRIKFNRIIPSLFQGSNDNDLVHKIKSNSLEYSDNHRMEHSDIDENLRMLRAQNPDLDMPAEDYLFFKRVAFHIKMKRMCQVLDTWSLWMLIMIICLSTFVLATIFLRYFIYYCIYSSKREMSKAKVIPDDDESILVELAS